jgi:TnpA family transposase
MATQLPISVSARKGPLDAASSGVAPPLPRCYLRGENSLFASAARQALALQNLYGGVIDWALIESHWKEFLRVALAIQSGRVEASWILTRLNSYSRRNKIYRAFRELGCVFRTIYYCVGLIARSCAER